MPNNVTNISEQSEKINVKLDGIKGWLIILAIGIATAPFVAAAYLYLYILTIIQASPLEFPLSQIIQEVLQLLQIVQSESLKFTSFKIYTGLYLIYQTTCLALAINNCKLFFQKKSSFPRFYIFSAIFFYIGFLSITILGFVVVHFFMEIDISLIDSFKSSGGVVWPASILFSFFWILYICKSKRVKTTFRK